MDPKHAPGDRVQTPLGKGTLREVRGAGRLLVEIDGRRVLFDAAVVRPVEPPKKTSKKRRPSAPGIGIDAADIPVDARRSAPEVDLHGLVVEEALGRALSAINDALLAGASQLRLIHGRSGGRIKAALHRDLRHLPSVRAFRLDPRNDGVTIVEF
jgi:DNA mismatch repair protein MutS2